MTQTIDYTALLAQGSKTKASRPPIIMTYGEKKLGKTTFASQFPTPAFLCGEDGAHGIADHRWPAEGVIQSWSELINYTRAFAYAPSHPFQTIVADTTGPLANLCLAHTVEKSGKGSWEKMAYGKEEDLLSEWRIWLSLLEQCRNKRGMHIVLISHVEARGLNNTVLGERVYVYQGEMIQKLWTFTSNWVDILMYAYRDSSVHVPPKGRGKPRAMLTEDRWLATKAATGFEAGVRGGYWLPDRLPLSYEAFADEISETPGKVRARILELAKKIEAAQIKTKEGKPILVESVKASIASVGDNIQKLQAAEDQLQAFLPA